MSKSKITNTRKRHFSFRDLSLQQRLPLLISILLMSILFTFSLISYLGVRNAVLKVGKDRLQSLTEQLSIMFSANRKAFIANSVAAANKPAVKTYLVSEGKDSAGEVSKIFEDIRKDSATVGVELKNSLGLQMMKSMKDGIEIKINVDSILAGLSMQEKTDSGRIGKLYAIDSSIYYPVIATVTDKNKPVGYLIRWRKMTTTTKALEQFSQLLGTDARLFVGNDDGKLWTDMRAPVAMPELMNRPKGIFEFKGSGKNVLVYVRPFANGHGLVAIELSRKKILETANHFLRWVILIGILLISVGIFFAWIMSRRITKPLKKLTEATTAIASGDYTTSVEVDSSDEFGKLASAFNKMTVEVRNSQQYLEKKVQERTTQLESANKELEAFSYSISHDLRAPLRAIIGFTAVLEEEYTNQLDKEAKRITTVIKDNTIKMSRLIDDLLTFSRMSRQEIIKSHINTGEMIKEIINELIYVKKGPAIKWVLQPLPAIHGDLNMFRQVWVNLISNAVKYSGNEKHPQIEIGTFIHEGQITFFIKDNGVGFDERYKEKLFKVFQRLHSSAEFEGTGVGLAIVEKIISKHGGKVWAEGTVANGASFYYSLPTG